jgi:hypothetical protein
MRTKAGHGGGRMGLHAATAMGEGRSLGLELMLGLAEETNTDVKEIS